MSRLLISGPGHSGGNWVTEICRATGKYNFTERVEDRNILYYDALPEGYASKVTTDLPGIHFSSLGALLDKYDDMKIIFTFRHPLDNCLSKIVRGMPLPGNEPFTDLIDFSYEATLFGSVKSIEYAFLSYTVLLNTYPERVTFVKLEDLILNEEDIVHTICDFIGVKFSTDYLNAYSRTQNKLQVNRYKGKLDKSQINMYKKWDTIYNNFYSNKQLVVKLAAQLSYPIILGLGYTYEGI